MNMFQVPKKLSVATISAILVMVIGGWFYFSYAEEPVIPALLSLKKTAIFSIESPEKVLLNQPFKMSFIVNTHKNTINAIGLTINYESEKIKVLSLDTTQSFCQFYPEKKFNDNVGKITLSCGSPSPGFSGQNTVVVVEVMPVRVGSTNISVDQVSKILRSDGKGTNLISIFPKQTINIINGL